MPYQRSTQAKGFTKRTVSDESKKLKEYATVLDKQRKEDVKAWERQDALWTREATRIDKLATAKDTYELANLQQFSKTLQKTLEVTAENVIKPINEAQVDEGVKDGVAAAQGDVEARKKIALQEEQIAEINAKVAEQRKKVLESADNIEAKWDETKYKASLEEKYRLLNLKKLGGNHAYGFRIGYLMQANTGYGAWRDNVLTPNTDIPLSQETVPGTDLVIGNYRSYSTEEKKSILAYVNKQYILDKGAGMKSTIVDKYLTRPLLEQTAKFQNKEYEIELANWADETENDLKTRFTNSLEGIDTNTDALKESIDEIILTYPSISKALNLPGSHKGNTKKMLLELFTSEVSPLKVGAIANVDDQEDFINFANTEPIVIPGVTPKEGLPLFKIWPTEFNEASFRLDLMTASAEKFRKRKASQELLANQAWQGIFAAYREDGIFENYKAGLQLIKEEYGGWVTPQMLQNWEGSVGIAVMPIEQAEQYMANEVFKDDDTILFVGDKALSQVPQKLINEYIEKGKILKTVYQFPTDKSVHKNQSELVTSNVMQLLKDITQPNADIKFTKDHPQLTAFSSHASRKILKLGWEIFKQNGGEEGDITLAQSLKQASTEVLRQVTEGRDVEGHLYHMNADKGFTNAAFNVINTSEDYQGNDEQIQLQKNTVEKGIQVSRDHYGTNVWLSKEIPVIVDNPRFYKLGNTGNVHPIWTQLENRTGIPGEILYNWQAAKLPPGLKIQPKVWNQDQQNKINLWKTTNPNDYADLTSGDSVRISRALQKKNVVDLASLAHAVVDDNGTLPVSEGEYKPLLEKLGLDSSISYEEFLSKPELVNQVFNQKAMDLVDQVETMTSNPREGIRMVLAGLKFGDVNAHQSADAYTLYTIYQTEDPDLIAKLNSGFNMDSRYIKTSSLFETDKYFGDNTVPMVVDNKLVDVNIHSLNSIEDIDTALNSLEKPTSKVTVVESGIPISAGPVSNMIGQWFGADKKTIPSREYVRFESIQQSLNDRKLILERITQGDLIHPGDWNRAKKYGSSKIFDALNRVLGDRVETLTKKAASMPGNVEANYLPLVMAQPEFVQFATPNAYITNEEDNISNELSAYEPGGGLIGNIGDQDLTPVEGHYGTKITIRNDVADKLTQMKDAATKDGFFLAFTSDNSGYRSSKKQTEIYNQWKRGELPNTPYVATPGTSEHESGKAVDFDLNAMANQQTFSEKAIRVMMRKLGNSSRDDALNKLREEWGTETHTWLVNNADKYGFKQTFENEPWHWVYDPSLLNKGDVD